MMNFFEPLYIYYRWLSDNHEDAFLYRKLYEETSFYIACGGVGGSQKGEKASHLTCEAVVDYMNNHQIESPYTHYFDYFVRFINLEFDKYIKHDEASKAIATTLVLLILHQNNAVVINICDSWTYHIWRNEIRFKTQNHSLVDELLLNHIITSEKIKKHSQKNIILWAISREIIKSIVTDVYITSDVQDGDYFFVY